MSKTDYVTDLDKLPARLSLGHAAAVFDLSEKTIRRWIGEGKIKAYRLGGRTIRVDRDSLLKLERAMN